MVSQKYVAIDTGDAQKKRLGDGREGQPVGEDYLNLQYHID